MLPLTSNDTVDTAISWSTAIDRLLSNDGILLVAGLFAVGGLLKKIPFFPNQFIPLAILVASTDASLYMFENHSVMQRLLIAVIAAMFVAWSYELVLRYVFSGLRKLAQLLYQRITGSAPPDSTTSPFPPNSNPPPP